MNSGPWARRWGGLVVLGLLCACGSVMDYVKGPMPPSPLPDPEVGLVIRERGEGGRLGAAKKVFAIPGPLEGDPSGDLLEVVGRVTRVVRRLPPHRGFRIEVESQTYSATLDVTTFREMPDLDLKPGTVATIEAKSGPGGKEVQIRDGGGVVFRLFAGSEVPDMREGDGFEMNVMPRQAFMEVRSGMDLCRLAVVHHPVRLRRGAMEVVLEPGEAKTLCDEQKKCLFVVVADARETYEQECGTKAPPFQAVFWSRVPADAAVRP